MNTINAVGSIGVTFEQEHGKFNRGNRLPSLVGGAAEFVPIDDTKRTSPTQMNK